VTVTVSGGVPGLTVNAYSPGLQGRPSMSGEFAVAITSQDATGVSRTSQYDVIVAPAQGGTGSGGGSGGSGSDPPTGVGSAYVPSSSSSGGGGAFDKLGLALLALILFRSLISGRANRLGRYGQRNGAFG
jgi:hypothetical protein